MSDHRPRLSTKVITLREAQEFVDRHHRHHRRPVGHKLSIGVRVKGTDVLVGVAIVSRPVARLFDDGGDTLEVSRTCTDGTRNANSTGRFGACAAKWARNRHQRLSAAASSFSV